MEWAIVEEKDHNALHGIYDSKECAEKALKETIPKFVERGFYTNKALTAEDFEVIKRKEKANG